MPPLSSEKDIISFTINGIEAVIDQSARTISLELLETDLSSLTPTIVISANASVNPSSTAVQDFTNPVMYTVTAEDGSTEIYEVSVSSLISSFSFGGKNYEIIQRNMSWSEAAAFAVSRNGILAEINDADEQSAVFDALNDAEIEEGKSVAADGGNASYVWIGGNDFSTEGDWIWDGDNDTNGVQFWMGDFSGSPVGGLYNNWGNEPDDAGSGQDGLGLALTNWPLGLAGQWNDLDLTNELYFVIELN